MATFLEQFEGGALDREGVEVIRGNERVVHARSEKLHRILQIPVVNERFDHHAWGDIDLVAAKDGVPIAIVSCKTSLHGRLTETLFYSLLYRTVKNLRVVVATPDRGRQGGVGWQSEWGSLESPTKDRLLAEAFLAGVYVENTQEWCPEFTPGPGAGTKLGGVVKPLTMLPKDLVRWSLEISRS